MDRALEKLELLLKRRGVTLSATALGMALGASAVAAAPAGLAVSISTVVLAGGDTGSGTALTFLKIMSVTKLKAGIIGVILVAVVATLLVIQNRAQSKLREENEALRRQKLEATQKLEAENRRLSNLLTQVKNSPPSTNDQSREVLKLRGEVGKLRQENTSLATSKTNGPSALSAMRSDPEMWKVIRQQQKMGMRMMFGEFAKQAKLTKEQTESLNDTLADYVMDSIDRVTEVLRDGKTGSELNAVFDGQDAALMEKLKTLLEPEALSQYQDYSKNLASYLTGEQFKDKLTGDKAAKDEKAIQLRQLMQEETQAALASAGLPADFQTVPILNFRNIASETEAEKNLKLLDSIYERVSARAGSFLSAEEMKSFGEFRATAVSNNRTGLLMNRKMMAPGSK